MSRVTVQPIQWRALLDIDEVRPIDESDAPVLDEVRAVLEKYGYLDRFGVALLHRHFDLSTDEVMLETTDVDAREHWVRPVSRTGVTAKGFDIQTTIVRFDDAGMAQYCTCARDKHGHTGGHGSFTE